jgi:hypothetical protein
VPTAYHLGDGSLKADYDSQLRVRHDQDIAQIEKDDHLALELLREEEEQLRQDKEIRAALLLEDTRIAAELAQRLKEEASKTFSTKCATSTAASIQVNGFNRKVTQKLKKASSSGGSKQSDKLSQQKNGILNYFSSNSDYDSNGESFSQGQSNSSCRSTSSIDRGKRKRTLDLHPSERTSSFSSSAASSFWSQTNDNSSHKSTRSAPKKAAGESAPVTAASAASSSPIDITSPLSQSQLHHHCELSPPSIPSPLLLSTSTLSSSSSSPFITKLLPWNCATCTFSNHGLLTACEICGDQRRGISGGRKSRFVSLSAPLHGGKHDGDI